MTYQQALNWMYAQLPMYQRQGKVAFKKDLTNISAFANVLHSPHKKFKSVHVGGTNGKGSTSHMLASVLQEAGYKVGLYTSPHLKCFTERIRINGKEIPKRTVSTFVKKNKGFLEKKQLSFFEMTVGIAFWYFAKEKVDIAIIEVGLGGRLDSTNIIIPEVSAITNIGLDHTQLLGETLSEIAFEKAGIIKKNIPVVIGEYQKETADVFRKKAKESNTTISLASDNTCSYKTDLLGDYQKCNVKTVVTVIEKLQGFNVSEENIKTGLLNVVKNTNFKGRWQVLQHNPKVICDTAHNKDGLKFVLPQLLQEKYKQLHIVIGVVSDKDLSTVLPLFPKNAIYYFCKPNIPRGLSAEILQQRAARFGLKGNVFCSVNQAFKKAKLSALAEDVVYVGGSTFVVAEVI